MRWYFISYVDGQISDDETGVMYYRRVAAFYKILVENLAKFSYFITQNTLCLH